MPEGLQSWTALLSLLLPFLYAGRASRTISKRSSRFILYLLGVLGPLLLWIVYLKIGAWLNFKEPGPPPSYAFWLFDWIPEGAWVPDLIQGIPAGFASIVENLSTIQLVVYASVFVIALGFFAVDVNRTSLHNFYRDRLSRAFLFYSDDDGDIIQDREFKGMAVPDELKLSQLNAPKTAAPYHLLNATLNLQQSKSPRIRQRGSDFFVFGKRFVGGPAVGYCQTEELERMDTNLTLATAMAVSGAAASPSMGTATIRPLRFILAILNVRLAYWLPNPGYVRSQMARIGGRLVKALIRAVGPLYFLYELFGRLHERSRMVNLSDGGHLENLGVYELLRRRCKFIIACDAEKDHDLNFRGLAEVIRFARIDLSINIDINLDPIRYRDPEERLSGRRWALARIRYGEDESQTGYLLYVKSALNGNEDEVIRDYSSRHKSFPHQSTTDQSFTEDQFEAYRRLGRTIAAEVFEDSDKGTERWPASSETSTDGFNGHEEDNSIPELKGLFQGLWRFGKLANSET